MMKELGDRSMLLAEGGTLKNPTKADCMVCHREKPSHAILKKKPFNYEKAWKRITHPMPEK
jgi:hypothetical protein